MGKVLEEVPTCELAEELRAREELANARSLNRVSRQEKKAVLSNAIVNCMRAHKMTLENLDEAYADVWEIYKKSAML